MTYTTNKSNITCWFCLLQKICYKRVWHETNKLDKAWCSCECQTAQIRLITTANHRQITCPERPTNTCVSNKLNVLKTIAWHVQSSASSNVYHQHKLQLCQWPTHQQPLHTFKYKYHGFCRNDKTHYYVVAIAENSSMCIITITSTSEMTRALHVVLSPEHSVCCCAPTPVHQPQRSSWVCVPQECRDCVK